MKIKIRNGDDAKKFVNDVSKFPCDINLHDGHQVFDAKSIMAVLTLDFSKEFEIRCISDDSEILEKFKEVIKYYEI